MATAGPPFYAAKQGAFVGFITAPIPCARKPAFRDKYLDKSKRIAYGAAILVVTKA